MKINNRINRDSRSNGDSHFLNKKWLSPTGKWLSLIIIISALIFIAMPGILPAEEKQTLAESAQYPNLSDSLVRASAQDKISLDLKNIDIVELLRIISLKTGRTIVSGKEVSGKITIYLSNVAFNDVLDIILLTQNLASYNKENVYYVLSNAEYRKIYGRDYIDQRKVEMVKLAYAKPSVVFNALGQLKSDVGKIVVDETSGTIILIDIPEKLELMKKTIKEVDRSLDTAVFDLNYAKLADVKIQLGSAITPGTGEVIIDERSGKAIMSDLPDKMQKLSMLVRELDEPSRQVYVEADIIELTLSDQFQRGIDWEKAFSDMAVDGLALAGYFPAGLTAAYQRISLGTLARNKYKGILNFLDTYGKTNVISQPRIAVINNEEANVIVGVRQPYVTTTQSQATSSLVTSETVEFIDVGIKLKIVPRIGADGFITMKIKPEISSLGTPLTTALLNEIPVVQTSQSETVVKVKDGMMIMIAGMLKTEQTDDIKGWPVLSKIPFLGIVFSNRDKLVKKTEVIIFLTPHIISGDAGLRGEEIKNIVPMEYLPESLQKKVIRDEIIDKALINPEAAAQEKPVIKEKAQKIPVPQTIALDMPKESAKDYYKKGLRSQAELNNKDAENYFKKAIELDKKFPAAYNGLGIIYEQAHAPDKAQKAYLKAIEIDENYLPAYSNLALFNEERGDWAQALIYWRKRVLYGGPDDEWTKKALQRLRDIEK